MQSFQIYHNTDVFLFITLQKSFHYVFLFNYFSPLRCANNLLIFLLPYRFIKPDGLTQTSLVTHFIVLFYSLNLMNQLSNLFWFLLFHYIRILLSSVLLYSIHFNSYTKKFFSDANVLLIITFSYSLIMFSTV